MISRVPNNIRNMRRGAFKLFSEGSKCTLKLQPFNLSFKGAMQKVFHSPEGGGSEKLPLVTLLGGRGYEISVFRSGPKEL